MTQATHLRGGRFGSTTYFRTYDSPAVARKRFEAIKVGATVERLADGVKFAPDWVELRTESGRIIERYEVRAIELPGHVRPAHWFDSNTNGFSGCDTHGDPL